MQLPLDPNIKDLSSPERKAAWHYEEDPRILRALLDIANNEVSRLHSVVKQIESEQSKTSQIKLNLEETIKVLRKRFFGKKSEKSASTRERDRLNADPELTVHSQNLLPPPSKKKTRNIPHDTRVYEASPEFLKTLSQEHGFTNPSSDQWEEIPGLFDKSTEIEITERVYTAFEHRRKKYRPKKEFAITEKDIIVAAPGPLKILPGASYSIDFTVSVVTDKYLNHIPLERQTRQMESVGLCGMSTQVLYNLVRIASEHLNEVAEKIKSEILKIKLVHSDETRWPITNGHDSDGYMWIISNNAGSHYRYEPTRSGKVVKETLEGYCGTIMSDAYSGYYQFRSSQTQNLALCHAHARRYFKDIEETNPIVKEILDFWEELFKIEKLARDFNDLAVLRKSRSVPIIEKMHDWLWEKITEARPEGELKKAIEYSLNHWKELTKFLKDPVIPLSNNEAERSIRQAVMGRKNFYGSRSIDGADTAAIMYTIIESCKKVELDPRQYLQITLRKLAAGDEAETPFQMALRLRQ